MSVQDSGDYKTNIREEISMNGSPISTELQDIKGKVSEFLRSVNAETLPVSLVDGSKEMWDSCFYRIIGALRVDENAIENEAKRPIIFIVAQRGIQFYEQFIELIHSWNKDDMKYQVIIADCYVKIGDLYRYTRQEVNAFNAYLKGLNVSSPFIVFQAYYRIALLSTSIKSSENWCVRMVAASYFSLISFLTGKNNFTQFGLTFGRELMSFIKRLIAVNSVCPGHHHHHRHHYAASYRRCSSSKAQSDIWAIKMRNSSSSSSTTLAEDRITQLSRMMLAVIYDQLYDAPQVDAQRNTMCIGELITDLLLDNEHPHLNRVLLPFAILLHYMVYEMDLFHKDSLRSVLTSMIRGAVASFKTQPNTHIRLALSLLLSSVARFPDHHHFDNCVMDELMELATDDQLLENDYKEYNSQTHNDHDNDPRSTLSIISKHEPTLMYTCIFEEHVTISSSASLVTQLKSLIVLMDKDKRRMSSYVPRVLQLKYVILDTNVLIGHSNELNMWIRRVDAQFILPAIVKHELHELLKKRKKVKSLASPARRWLDDWQDQQLIHVHEQKISTKNWRSNDEMVVQCAAVYNSKICPFINTKTALLVTSDKNLMLRAIARKIPVVSPRDFWIILKSIK